MNQQTKNYIPYAIILLLILLLWFKNCKGNSEATPVIIKTPEVKGKFQSQKPTHTVISTEPKTSSTEPLVQNLDKDFYESEINKLLLDNQLLSDAFNTATDSLKKVMFTNVIATKSFSHTFDDQKLKATASGLISNGEVQSIKLDYTIKSQSIEVPKQKEVVFRLLGGVEVGNNSQFNDFTAKVNLGFQNRNGGIISVAADSEKRYYIGYTTSIFKIKGK